MNICQESERMAETNFKGALDRIRIEYEAKRYNLRFHQTNHRENIETARLFLATLPSVSDALTDCYLEAFKLEGKVPDRDDASRLDYRLETLFAGNWGLDTGNLDLNTIEQQIREIETLACQKLNAKIHGMILEAARPQRATHELNIGNNYAPIMQGPGGTQTINVIKQENGILKIRWSQLRPEVGTQRVSGVGDVEVSEEDIQRAKEVGGDPWVELHDATTFGSPVRKYALGLFSPA
jgi:hypothetical protein